MKYTTLLLLSIVLALLTGACNTSGCTDNRSSLLIAGFYSSETLRPLLVDSLEIGGVNAPHDSLLMNAGDRKNEIYLPLMSSSTSLEYFIRYVSRDLNFPELYDTLRLNYTSEPYFASEECGAIYRYHIDGFTYTRHLIDSIALPDSLINNANVQNMRIMFRTASANE
ncbi:MAG: DUF6452 family protein [Clostridiales bacterium]|nr:DUF6452 family protein [Clostridiales bacterium]